MRIHRFWRGPTARHKLLFAGVGPAAVTLLAIPEDHPEVAAVAVLYVLSVVIAARVGGALAGIAASILSFLAFNFFFTPPLHTFAVAAPEDLVSLFAFLVASAIVGLLLSAALEAKAKAERRELEARLLNRMATRLLSGEPTEKVLDDLAVGIRDVFHLESCQIATPLTPRQTETGSRAANAAECIPLKTGQLDLGEIRLSPGKERPLTEDDRSAIRSLGTQLALALEGIRLSAQVRRAELQAHESHLKAALFSGVTHDVKTPLAAITAAATSLMDGDHFPEKTRREHLETIKQEAERLHRVVNNLLDVARLRAGVLVPTKIRSPIEEVMESVLNRLRPHLHGREVDIRVGDQVAEVPIDVVQIDQVLTNLIENALKFTPAGSPISLLAVGNQDSVRVTVSDQGPGISRDHRARILEPFERGDSISSGTGLGLAICNAIVVAHGGRMWISDNPQGGAAFTFELPCTTDPTDGEVISATANPSG
jgi:two-component system, OmpR family, sensor histidine kinase KdpD